METYALPSIKVSEIMTQKVTTVNKNVTIEALVKKFKRYDFHSFPVLHKKRVVGIVTKTDLLRVIDTKELGNIAATHVEDIMTPHPITIAPDALLHDAASSMRKNHIRILPVVEEGKLIGLLSYSDLVRTVFKG
jgi:predicted transcriptional regulator